MFELSDISLDEQGMHIWQIMFLMATLAAPPAMAQAVAPLTQLLPLAGTHAGDTAPDPRQLVRSPTAQQQLPMYRAAMAQPFKAPYRAGMLASTYGEATVSPHALISLSGALAGLRVARTPALALSNTEAVLRAAEDPLAASLAWMASMGKAASPWSPLVPDAAQLSGPLRFELAMVLSTLGQAHQFLQRAFARLPASVTPELLRRKALDDQLFRFEEPDFRQLLPLIEREALQAGMLDLVAVMERLQHFVTTTPHRSQHGANSL